MRRKQWLVVGALALCAAVLLLRRAALGPAAPVAASAAVEAGTSARAVMLGVRVRSAKVPFSGAKVQLFDAELGHLLTQKMSDADGAAEFRDLATKAVLVVVEHPELERRAEHVALDAPRTERTIDLARGVSIRGAVTDEGGEAVVSAVVEAISEDSGKTKRSSRTDSAGRFALMMLAPGVYQVKVATGRHLPYISPVLQLSSPGASVTHDVRLEAGRVLAGRVVDASGKPVVGASVGSSDPGSGATTTDAEGRFELKGMGDKPINVFAAHPGFAATHERGLRAGVRGVELRLERESKIRGRIHWPAGVDEMLISACHYDTHFKKELCVVRVQLRRPDAKYTLGGLPAGRFDVVLEGDGVVTQRVSATVGVGVVTELTPLQPQLAP